MKQLDAPIGDLARVFEPVPQILENVRFSTGLPLENEKVQSAIAAAEQRLGNQGRLVIRKSGTEPLIASWRRATMPRWCKISLRKLWVSSSR